MKILFKNPQEIVPPIETLMFRSWYEGAEAQKKAYEDAMVDANLSEMAVNWILDDVQEIGETLGKVVVKTKRPFEEYLKEHLEV